MSYEFPPLRGEDSKAPDAATNLSREDLSDRYKTEEILGRTSPWLPPESPPSEHPRPKSEPTNLSGEELRDAQDTEERLRSQLSAWHE